MIQIEQHLPTTRVGRVLHMRPCVSFRFRFSVKEAVTFPVPRRPCTAVVVSIGGSRCGRLRLDLKVFKRREEFGALFWSQSEYFVKVRRWFHRGSDEGGTRKWRNETWTNRGDGGGRRKGERIQIILIHSKRSYNRRETGLTIICGRALLFK